MNILVTGRSGSGKSTVCLELVKLHAPAFDADRVEGLAGWVDVRTGEPTSVDYTKIIDKRTVGWFWDRPVLENFLAERDTTVLCGSADNQPDFYELFGKVIFLAVPADVQAERIMSRAEHDYGQAPGMVEQIVREQADVLGKLREYGATILNANRPPGAIARDILRHML